MTKHKTALLILIGLLGSSTTSAALKVRLSLQDTAESLNLDSLTHPGTKSGEGQELS